MKWKRAAVLACAALVAAFVSSVDMRHGDLRFDLNNLTMRHWDVVKANIAFNAGCAAGFLPSGGYPCGGGTTYTLVGPSSASFAIASSNFTAAGSSVGVTITPNDSSKHGIFTPSSVNLTVPGATFNYEALETGTITVATTNSDSLSDPAGISVTVANALSTGYPGFTSGWNLGNSAPTLTTGTADPWGGTTGATLTESSAVGAYQNIYTNTISAVPTVTVALFVKQSVAGTNGTPSVELNINNPTFAAGGSVIVTPSTCVVVSTNSWGGATIISSSATKPSGIGTGWCLAQFDIALGATYTTSIEQIFVTSGNTDLITGDGTSALFIYGPVME